MTERFGRRLIAYLRVHPGILAAYLFAAILVLLAIAGETIAPHNPRVADIGSRLLPPSGSHWFGTDSAGIDVFSAVISAPRIDLTIALVGVTASFVIGVSLGLISAFFDRGIREAISQVILRVTDMVQSFPVFVLAMAMVASSGQKIQNVVYAVAFVNIPFYLRLVNTQGRALRRRAFVDSARVSGVPTWRILLRHMLPNTITPALAQMSVNFGWAILLTAGLSFAGAGVRSPTPEWGLMIARGVKDVDSGHWWTALFPGLALTLTVFCFALIGRSLEEVLDPLRRTPASEGPDPAALALRGATVERLDIGAA